MALAYFQDYACYKLMQGSAYISPAVTPNPALIASFQTFYSTAGQIHHCSRADKPDLFSSPSLLRNLDGGIS